MWTRRGTHESRHSHSCATGTRQSWNILVFVASELIYWHISENFEMRQEQVENVIDKTNVPFTISFSSCLMLPRWECKPGIRVQTRHQREQSEHAKQNLKHTKWILGVILVTSETRVGHISKKMFSYWSCRSKLNMFDIERECQWSISVDTWHLPLTALLISALMLIHSVDI